MAAGFFVAFGLVAFGLAAFGLAAAGFLAPAALGFFGVVAFLAAGFAAFLVAAFFGFAAPVFFALVCVVFFAFVPAADFFAPVFGFDALDALAFFGLAAADVAVVVVDDVVAAGADPVAAELLVFAAVATFLAGLDPADFERGRFFVVDADFVDEDFFALVDFFFVGLALSFNLNEPLAPLPLVCLSAFDLTPFLRANLRC